ncbi:LysR family transcriptional regulator [Halocynthiibacter sp.]|uniref:LysR family transcriptional regulator n=1 Tax=Halocynthiibacter sp. TaxID=1979210 RepID=UPI003C4032E6
MPNLVWLRTFETAARHLNFTTAADELAMTQAAVSQHIRALESRLGCDLFVRDHRKLSLTDMAQAYLPAVQKALRDLSFSTNGLFGPGFDDLVTVRAPVSTAILYLAPLMHQFRNRYPRTRIRMVSSIWGNMVSGERVDVELRLGFGDWEGMQAEKISDEHLVPICRRGARGDFPTPEHFLHTPLIHIIGFDDNWTRYFSANGFDGQTGTFGVSVDTTAAAFDLVGTGAGCASVIHRFAQAGQDTGRQIDIAGDAIDFPQSHYFLTPHNAPPERRIVTEFKDWLREVLAQ